MARDKGKDDLSLNCEEEYELELVASHYGANKLIVYYFLIEKCKDKTIFHSKHMQVYRLIKDVFGYEIPV